MKVYENAKRLAESRGISVRRLSLEAGLSDDTISKWRKVEPTMRSLKKVAHVLGVRLTDLIGEE